MTDTLSISKDRLTLPPLSLYVHIPWCVQKCPYCDFNSHALKGGIPEKEYVAHLLDDLTADLAFVQGRSISTIFFGGGTPSLLSEEAMATLLKGIESRVPFADDIEITLEANPGTLETNKFKGFNTAGVNRISIGVQSFEAEKLEKLGRIHNSDEALKAASFAHESVPTFNLDLMHGLPNQTLEQALADLKQAIALNPYHISWYQLTIEPNTLFHSKPPKLPEDETLWEIQAQGHELLKQAGYEQYEISAYAKTKFEDASAQQQGQNGQHQDQNGQLQNNKHQHQCRHNLNYWQFGDYLGIGCGAHGKITDMTTGTIVRTEKVKHPKGYMDLSKPYRYQQWQVDAEELPFEYFMNRLRLRQSFTLSDFEQRTGLASNTVIEAISKGISLGLLEQIAIHNKSEYKTSDLRQSNRYQITPQGLRYYNNLVDLFL